MRTTEFSAGPPCTPAERGNKGEEHDFYKFTLRSVNKEQDRQKTQDNK